VRLVEGEAESAPRSEVEPADFVELDGLEVVDALHGTLWARRRLDRRLPGMLRVGALDPAAVEVDEHAREVVGVEEHVDPAVAQRGVDDETHAADLYSRGLGVDRAPARGRGIP
jgi:hypothetical protein